MIKKLLPKVKDLFEQRVHEATNQPGCRRVELLTTIDADYHVIQAYWESQEAFKAWRSSDAFQNAHADLPPDLFAGPNQLELYELTTEINTNQ